MKNSIIRLAALAGVALVASTCQAQNAAQAENAATKNNGVVQAGFHHRHAVVEGSVEGDCYGDSCYSHGAACYGGRCHALHCGHGHRRVIPGVARLHEAWPYNPDNWHGQYYHTSYGAPVALVAPPNMSNQTKWAWGVGNTTSVPVYNQFGRQYPGPASPGGWGAGYAPTPRWPSSTDQFGVYYVRGPW